jgi:quinol---cytochrome c reductase iron-sulfur subunit, bacillus type
MTGNTSPTSGQTPRHDRRGFCKRVVSILIGGTAGAVPVATGWITFLNPLREKSSLGGFVHVASLEAVPADGLPRKFTVISDRVDAWNKFPDVPIGAVYLRRTGPRTIEALNVVCPHAGCFVDYVPARRGYFCPCHHSRFTIDGRIADPRSPAARGMDTLAVVIRNRTEIWVKFQNYRAGLATKVPVA